MWDAPTLGTREQIVDLDSFILYRDLFLLGCYSIMFFYVSCGLYQPDAKPFPALLCRFMRDYRCKDPDIWGPSHYSINGKTSADHFLEYGTRLWFPVLLMLMFNEELSGRISKRVLSWFVLMISLLPLPWRFTDQCLHLLCKIADGV